MNKYISIIILLFIACNNTKETNHPNMELIPLSPYTYTFDNDHEHNRIDYYFMDMDFSYNEKSYRVLKDEIQTLIPAKSKFHLFSIYIYKKTEILNANYDKGKEWLDGQNQDLIAYLRFSEDALDIYYILKDGFVIYDGMQNEKVNFEFEQ